MLLVVVVVEVLVVEEEDDDEVEEEEEESFTSELAKRSAQLISCKFRRPIVVQGQTHSLGMRTGVMATVES